MPNFQVSKADLRNRLLRAAARGMAPVTSAPIWTSVAWASGQTIAAGEIRYSGSRVYGALKAGTSGATPPSGTAPDVSDGGVPWAYMGERLAVAWATGLSVAAGQVLYNQGYAFQAATTGTTAASGNGPTPASLTDNTVTWTYLGEQTQPLVSPPAVTWRQSLTIATGQLAYNGTYIFRASAGGTTASSGTGPTPGSLSDGSVTWVYVGDRIASPQTTAWNSPNITYLGGTPAQVGANPRATITTVNYDGVGSSRGSVAPNIATVFEGQRLDIWGMFYHQAIWVDDVLVAIIAGTNGTTTSEPQFVNVDWSGVRQPRKERRIRVTGGVSTQFYGFVGGPTDTFTPYVPYDNLSAVLVSDSYGEGGSALTDVYGMASQLGRALGIDDFTISASGGTGPDKANGGRVDYTGRFTIDVINRNPHVVIIQQSQNITSTSGNNTNLAACVARVKAELPNAMCIVMGVWNTKSQNPLSGTPLTLNDNARAIATAANVPFVDWSTHINGTGQVDSKNSNGNADMNITWDGTHRTPRGHQREGFLLPPKFVAAYRGWLG